MGGWGSSSIRPSSKSSTPVNRFSELTRDIHFEKHGKEYDAKNVDEYEMLAKEFRDSPIDKNTREFISQGGLKFKYNLKSNDFLIYKNDGEFVTFYKPDRGLDYWEDQVNKYGPKE
jgi:pyocin large subunit-like protein